MVDIIINIILKNIFASIYEQSFIILFQFQIKQINYVQKLLALFEIKQCTIVIAFLKFINSHQHWNFPLHLILFL